MFNRDKIKELQFKLRDDIEKKLSSFDKFEFKRISRDIVVYQENDSTNRAKGLTDEYLAEMTDIHLIYKYRLSLIEEEIPEDRSEGTCFGRDYRKVETEKKCYDTFIELYKDNMGSYTIGDNVKYEFFGNLIISVIVKYSSFKEEMFEHIKNLNT